MLYVSKIQFDGRLNEKQEEIVEKIINLVEKKIKKEFENYYQENESGIIIMTKHPKTRVSKIILKLSFKGIWAEYLFGSDLKQIINFGIEYIKDFLKKEGFSNVKDTLNFSQKIDCNKCEFMKNKKCTNKKRNNSKIFIGIEDNDCNFFNFDLDKSNFERKILTLKKYKEEKKLFYKKSNVLLDQNIDFKRTDY